MEIVHIKISTSKMNKMNSSTKGIEDSMIVYQTRNDGLKGCHWRRVSWDLLTKTQTVKLSGVFETSKSKFWNRLVEKKKKKSSYFSKCQFIEWFPLDYMASEYSNHQIVKYNNLQFSRN